MPESWVDAASEGLELFEQDWADYCDWLDEQRNDAEMEIQYEYAMKEGLVGAYC